MMDYKNYTVAGSKLSFDVTFGDKSFKITVDLESLTKTLVMRCMYNRCPQTRMLQGAVSAKAIV